MEREPAEDALLSLNLLEQLIEWLLAVFRRL